MTLHKGLSARDDVKRKGRGGRRMISIWGLCLCTSSGTWGIHETNSKETNHNSQKLQPKLTHRQKKKKVKILKSKIEKIKLGRKISSSTLEKTKETVYEMAEAT